MKELIKDYIKKILEYGVHIQEGDALIVIMPSQATIIEEVLLELKDEYYMSDILFVKDDFEALYHFFETNPTNEEITEYVKEYRTVWTRNRVVTLEFSDYSTYPYHNEVIDTFPSLMGIYNKINDFKNNDLNGQMERSLTCATVGATSVIADRLFRDETNIDEAWELITRTVPGEKELKTIIRDLEEKTRYLNRLGINKLYFQTGSGSRFKVSIPPQARWLNGLDSKNSNVINFPTYEIFTSPNMYRTKGRVVLTKPSSIDSFYIKRGKLEFERGKVIKCISSNEHWNNFIMDSKNRLLRLGEIALVSSDSPIARLNRTFGEILLDENTGCHIALGDSFSECIKEVGDYFPFYSSLHHQDLVFGDNGTNVIADSIKGGKKRILMRNGTWV